MREFSALLTDDAYMHFEDVPVAYIDSMLKLNVRMVLVHPSGFQRRFIRDFEAFPLRLRGPELLRGARGRSTVLGVMFAGRSGLLLIVCDRALIISPAAAGGPEDQVPTKSPFLIVPLCEHPQAVPADPIAPARGMPPSQAGRA